MDPATAFPDRDHDHGPCVAAILNGAKAICDVRKVRLTAQRRRVLEIVAASHHAVGAYDVLERLAVDGKRPAPVTVYRALDFLIAHGLVHRLSSLNAYIACAHIAGAKSTEAHGAQFLICNQCGMIGEIADAGVTGAIAAAARNAGFDVAAPVVEVAGVCGQCREGSGRGRGSADAR